MQLKTDPKPVVKTKPKPVTKVTPDKIISNLPNAEAASPEPQKPTATAAKVSLSSPKAEIAWLGYKYISKNSVNVRALPSVKSLKVGNLKLNTQLKYYQYTGGWYQIKLPNSQALGWIRGDLLANDRRRIQSKPKTPLAIKSAKKAGPRRSPYYGTCDCPYDRTRKGARCGGRSAYSKPGGRSPVCYW